MKKRILATILTAIAILSLMACGGNSDGDSKKEEKEPEKKEYIEESQISEIFTNPDDFKGKYVVLTGQIFVDPEKDGDTLGIQAWHDPDNVQNNFVIHYKGTENVKTNDYIKVDGKIAGTFEGENMFGGTVTAPLIESDSIEVMSYMDAIVPALQEITPENAIAEQTGLSFKVDKVEFAEKETRVYITETNSSPDSCTISVYDIKILQNGQQINQDSSSMSTYNGNYAELPYDLLSGASASGVLVFPAMDSSASFQVHIEAFSDNWEIQFSPFVIDVSAN